MIFLTQNAQNYVNLEKSGEHLAFPTFLFVYLDCFHHASLVAGSTSQ